MCIFAVSFQLLGHRKKLHIFIGYQRNITVNSYALWIIFTISIQIDNTNTLKLLPKINQNLKIFWDWNPAKIMSLEEAEVWVHWATGLKPYVPFLQQPMTPGKELDPVHHPPSPLALAAQMLHIFDLLCAGPGPPVCMYPLGHQTKQVSTGK